VAVGAGWGASATLWLALGFGRLAGRSLTSLQLWALALAFVASQSPMLFAQWLVMRPSMRDKSVLETLLEYTKHVLGMQPVGTVEALAYPDKKASAAGLELARTVALPLAGMMLAMGLLASRSASSMGAVIQEGAGAGMALGVAYVWRLLLDDGAVMRFPAVARPRHLRAKLEVPFELLRAVGTALEAKALHALAVFVMTSLPLLRWPPDLTAVGRAMAGAVAALGSGGLGLPRGLFVAWFVASGWRLSMLMLKLVHTERHSFLPAVAPVNALEALQPLLSGLDAADSPFIQHLAYLDLDVMATTGGDGRRKDLFSDQSGLVWREVGKRMIKPLEAMTTALEPVDPAVPPKPAGVAAAGAGFGANAAAAAAVGANAAGAAAADQALAKRKVANLGRALRAIRPLVHTVAWSAHAAAALLVASRTQDTYGVAQLHTPDVGKLVTMLVRLSMALQAAKAGAVDAVPQFWRHRTRAQAQLAEGAVVAERVLDALRLSLFTIVEAFGGELRRLCRDARASQAQMDHLESMLSSL